MRRYNNFNLSYEHKTTGEMGYLIPIGWNFVSPSTIYRHSTAALIRLPALDAPVMHKVFVRIHHFFVRMELIYEGFKDWWTGGEDGNNSETFPYFQASSVTHSTLLNYLGIPAMAFGSTLNFNAAAIRAYAQIYNDFYRDSQEISKVTIDTTDGLDTTTNTSLLKVANPKNYITTLRSEPQLGDALTISVGGTAPVEGIGKDDQSYLLNNQATYETDGTGSVNYVLASNDTGDSFIIEHDANNVGYPNIRADLASASGLSVDDLRLSLALQRDREKKNNYGGRYEEVIRGEFGVNTMNSPDRAVYLGGGKNLLQFSEIIDTGTAQANIGDLYGHGIGAMKTNRYQKYFPEHGVVMSLLSVVPEPVYTEQCERKWLYDSRTDFFDPDLEYIGEQEVTNREVQIDHSSPTGTFGYAKVYDEQRQNQNITSGLFDTGQSYNNWHYGMEITGDSSLNQSHIECTPTKRVQQDTGEPALKLRLMHNIIAKMRMEKNPLPKFI